jgi:hypothetical protein
MFLEVRKMFVMARCVGKSVKEVVNVGTFSYKNYVL